jgi:hypothetical protein
MSQLTNMQDDAISSATRPLRLGLVALAAAWHAIHPGVP